jgi:hypothetical protein
VFDKDVNAFSVIAMAHVLLKDKKLPIAKAQQNVYVEISPPKSLRHDFRHTAK